MDELIDCAKINGVNLNRTEIIKIVETSEKKRFSLKDYGKYIRANYGHSIPVELGLKPTRPPVYLFHGTASRLISSIKQKGLVKEGRNYVHLSVDESTALKVGARHGRPVVLKVSSVDMHSANFEFYLSESGVWLTDHVPVKYILFVDA